MTISPHGIHGFQGQKKKSPPPSHVPGPEIGQTGARPPKPRPPGRTPGSGRQPGQRNAVTRELRQLAGEYTERALECLAKLMTGKDKQVALLAARELLDRAHGKVAPSLPVREGGGSPQGLTIALVQYQPPGEGDGRPDAPVPQGGLLIDGSTVTTPSEEGEP